MLNEIYEHGAVGPGHRVMSQWAREISAHFERTHEDAATGSKPRPFEDDTVVKRLRLRIDALDMPLMVTSRA